MVRGSGHEPTPTLLIISDRAHRLHAGQPPRPCRRTRAIGNYVGLSGAFGISLFGGQFESSSLENPKLGNSAGFQIKAGYRVASWLALEAQYEWLDESVLTARSDVPDETKKVAQFRPQTVTANLKFILPTGRIEPHVIVGLGVGLWEITRIQKNTSVQKSSFAARLGAGVSYCFLVNLPDH